MSENVEHIQKELKNLEDKITQVSTQLKDREEETKKIESLLSKFDDRFEDHETKLSEILSKITTFEEQFTKNKYVIEEKASAIANQSTALNEFKISVDERLATLQSQVNDQNEEAMELIQNLMAAFKQLTEKVDKLRSELTTRLDEEFGTITERVDELHGQQIKNREELENSIEVNVSGIGTLKAASQQFYKILENYGTTLQSHADILNQIRQDLPKYTNMLKNEQAEQMQYFQRILTGLEESIRSEVIVIGKSSRQMLEEWRNESEDLFFQKDDAQQIFTRVDALDKEIRQKADEIRAEMVKGLSEGMADFRDLLNQAIETMSQYKEDYKVFRDETQALIERRVNEKFDFVFDVLSKTVNKAEELKTMVLQLQLPPVPSPSVPVIDLSTKLKDFPDEKEEDESVEEKEEDEPVEEKEGGE